MKIPVILLIVSILATYVSLGKLFEKAGRPAWHGWVPIYNLFIWQKVTERPWYWVLILLVPGIQFVMLMIMHVNLVWSFGHRGTQNTLLAMFVPFYIIPKIAFDKKQEFTGNLQWKVPGQRNSRREWADALLFALIAAYIVRTFVFESFTIPTASMEKSMLVGDYLFVSKARYGAKVPETPIYFPLTHHTLPVLNIPSYLDWQKLDYNRLPGWSDVERNDPVVFNYPLGDTVIVEDEVTSWYQYVRTLGMQAARSPEKFEADRQRYEQIARENLLRNPKATVRVRPKDKKENYVKRCVGMPGDVLEIKEGQLMIDGQPAQEIPGIQFDYTAITSQELTNATKERLKDELDLNIGNVERKGNKTYSMLLTQSQREAIMGVGIIDSIYIDWEPKAEPHKKIFSVYPYHSDFDWSIDNFGPLTIPAKGMTIPLSQDNLTLYRRCIEVYEDHEVRVQDGQVLIDGEVREDYTFELDYYWMMGDNRHRSQDSRIFGFVPEDHIVGRPSFVWLSLDEERSLFGGKIRWSRMFKGVE